MEEFNPDTATIEEYIEAWGFDPRVALDEDEHYNKEIEKDLDIRGLI